jgi:acyl carrier protein
MPWLWVGGVPLLDGGRAHGDCGAGGDPATCAEVPGGPEDVWPDARLMDLRVDSLALEELRMMVEDVWGVDLEDVVVTPRDTVETLVAAVRDKVDAA